MLGLEPLPFNRGGINILALTDFPKDIKPEELDEKAFKLKNATRKIKTHNYFLIHQFIILTGKESFFPKATQVTLEVFNSVGQKVMELVNGQQSAGYHTATFDASGLSSGVYLYKLTTPSFTQTKKMLLIK